MLNDMELEMVCAGKADVKATLAKANAAFDAHEKAMTDANKAINQLMKG